jgi:hypothetical protein
MRHDIEDYLLNLNSLKGELTMINMSNAEIQETVGMMIEEDLDRKNNDRLYELFEEIDMHELLSILAHAMQDQSHYADDKIAEFLKKTAEKVYTKELDRIIEGLERQYRHVDVALRNEIYCPRTEKYMSI